MDFAGFRRQILAAHSGKPQEAAALEYALRELENSMTTLARLGHVWHLEPGTGPALPEWPRMMFHATSAPNGRLVTSEFALADLGPGWFDSLEEAQYSEGVKASWRGKTGRNGKTLPTDIGLPVVATLFDKEKAKREFFAKRKEIQDA